MIFFEVTGLFQQAEICAVCMDGEKKVGGDGGEDENFNVTPDKAFKTVAIKLSAKFSFP